MPPIFQQKSSVVALVSLLFGIIMHIKGFKATDQQTAQVEQLAGIIFDLVFANIAYVLSLHLKNATAVTQLKKDATESVQQLQNALDGHVDTPLAQAHPVRLPFVSQGGVVVARTADQPQQPTLADAKQAGYPVVAAATKAILLLALILPLSFLNLACVTSRTATTQPVAQISPADAQAMTSQAFSTMVKTLNQLRADGYISDTDWKHIQTVCNAAGAALDAWYANLNNGGAAQWQAAYQATVPEIVELIFESQKKQSSVLKQKTIPVLTQPSGGGQ